MMDGTPVSMPARAIMNSPRRIARLFLLELLVYGLFLTVYLYCIIQLLYGRLAALDGGHRTAYAFVALGLIVAQGIGLEIMTTQLIRRLSALMR